MNKKQKMWKNVPDIEVIKYKELLERIKKYNEKNPTPKKYLFSKEDISNFNNLANLYGYSKMNPIDFTALTYKEIKVLISNFKRSKPNRTCAYCKKNKTKNPDIKFRVCSKCKIVFYCSDTCHKKDWSRKLKLIKRDKDKFYKSYITHDNNYKLGLEKLFKELKHMSKDSLIKLYNERIYDSILNESGCHKKYCCNKEAKFITVPIINLTALSNNKTFCCY